MTTGIRASFGPREWALQPELLEPNKGHIYTTITKMNVISASRLDVDDEHLLPLLTSSVSNGADWTLKLSVEAELKECPQLTNG
ncbi:hypothetical protein N0V90_009908 [Kalmusia sp. IMI 367209]|nr:hypothetical protein N0V90_009908 [Kalmusia sp. IMI 367209]